MNYLDVFLALPVLWGIYRGFTKGFIKSLASLAALVLGIFVAVHFSGFFGDYVDTWFHPDPRYLKILTFALVFLVIVLLVKLTGWILEKLIKATAMGFLNRFAGILFGFIKWVFILSVLITIFESVERTSRLIDEKNKHESLFYLPISRVAPFVFPYLKFDTLRNYKVPEPDSPGATGEGG